MRKSRVDVQQVLQDPPHLWRRLNQNKKKKKDEDNDEVQGDKCAAGDYLKCGGRATHQLGWIKEGLEFYNKASTFFLNI